MHIVWLGKKSPFCGNVTYGREITNALLDRGYRVTFLHFAQSDDTADDHSAYEEVSLPFIFKSQMLTIPALGSARLLSEMLQKLQPDIVHASLILSPLDWKLPEICQSLSIPLVATFHPAFDDKRRNFSSSTQHLAYQVYAPRLANYDKVIVFSQIQRDLLVKLGVPSAKVAVIPNGVDISRYSPVPASLPTRGMTSAIKQQLEADQLYVYQGRISPEKNVESLLKGWKLAKMGPRHKLVIVGSGPLEASLKAFYTGNNIIWLGFVANEERRIEILRGADCFILPSLVEGLSLSLLEAMACGTACVATDAGADGEVLDQGAGVILSTQKVSTQLQTLFPLFREHPEIISLLGKKARSRVLERYTLSQNITALEQLYSTLITPARNSYFLSQGA
ncbi:MAG: glycosyltransferase family 4 protein [Phormidesmis sp. RL_2_1]|nr:glycosyltransferase family 4 protein [Phormidesmis sp. RL_2_1]